MKPTDLSFVEGATLITRDLGIMLLTLLTIACASPDGRPSSAASEQTTSTVDTPPTLSTPADTAHKISGPIPDAYGRAVEFLEYIKRPAENDADGTFDVSKGHFDDPERILAYVSPSGLTLYDINDTMTTQISPETIRSQLIDRRGRAFEMLVHLAHIYSQPFPQYSSLSYQLVANGIVVHVSDWYRLRFQFANGVLRLVRLEYVMEEIE